MRFTAILLLVAVALLLTPSVFAAEVSTREFLAKIGEMNSAPITEWRYIEGDVQGAENPSFDDSAWKVGKPEITYGVGPVGWVRTKVVLPEKIGGFAVTGSEAVLTLSVDDDGEIYVDGKHVRSFHWDQGQVSLTKDAKPGQSFNIAVKILNGGGPGRLMSAGLGFGASVAADARRLSEDMGMCERMIAAKMMPMGPTYQEALAKCISEVDRGAVDRGDSQAFLSSVAKAESELKPFEDVADQYTCHLIGHGHIDMNWLWLWPETVQVCQNTFNTMCNMIDEFPDFKYSQSQASTYVAVQNTKPETFSRIKKAVKEGRWEITGGTWVEGDMNMASGESIVRQMLYARQYFLQNFGKSSKICWEPDTFGHPWSVPQIVKKSGMESYFFMRCGVDKPVFWWEGIDGTRILAVNRSYSDSVNDGLPMRTMEVAQEIGIKDNPFVYGVGDHGGGPTRGDIERAIDINKRAVAPKMKFSTIGEFTEAALKQKKDYPVHNGELQFTFRGCYTTHGDVKLQNRKAENILPATEAFSVIANQLGGIYPMESFRESWRRTCFNQFHDILCGSGIHGTYDYSKYLFDKTEKQATTAMGAAMRTIASKVNTRGQGTPIVVFNPLAWTRTDLVETSCPFPEKDAKFYVVDATGRKLPAQRIGNSISFVARDVPSMGYRTYWVRRGAKPSVPTACAATSNGRTCTIENEFLRVIVDRETGRISSIFDKKAKREVIKDGQNGDALQALQEAPTGMSGWELGEIKGTTEISKARSVEVLQPGPVVSSIRVDHWYKSSLFAQDIKLYAGVPRLDIKMTADWREIGTPQTGSTMLKTGFTVNVEGGKATFEIPFAAIERKADGSEYPAQKWADLSNGSYGVSILNDCKYGHDVKDQTLRLTLLRCSYDPDPKPDAGIHSITYSLYPHAGDWRKAGTVRRAYELNNPLVSLATKAHRGTLAAQKSFLSVQPANVIVTGFKKAEDNSGTVVRFYESSGAPTKASVHIDKAATWCETNLMEIAEGKTSKVASSGIEVPMGKWEIKTLLVK